jgi:hypothetical protein
MAPMDKQTKQEILIVTAISMMPIALVSIVAALVAHQ